MIAVKTTKVLYILRLFNMGGMHFIKEHWIMCLNL